MAERYVGQIMPAAFNFAPQGTAFTQGQVLPVNQNATLFALIGTTYGGDGNTTFALPDTRGRTIIGFGSNANLAGQTGGETEHVLQARELPSHAHVANGSTLGTTDPVPTGRMPGVAVAGAPAYGAATSLVAMGSTTTTAGLNQAHNNMQPSLAINFVIVLDGDYPQRN